MLSLVALALAAAPAIASPTLAPTSAWWEKTIVTMSGDGDQQSCRYESSIPAIANEPCEMDAPSAQSSTGAAAGAYTKITFERRFTPGKLPEPASIEPGDQLLGGQIMALAIDAEGAVRGCEVIAMSGDVLPDYGCDEARAERFQASTGGQRNDGQIGYFTILVYGHAGQVV